MIKKSLVVNVNERSSHSVPTPHGGGIALALTWLAGLGYLYFTKQIDPHLFYALCCGVVVSVVSFLDDIYDLSPKKRLLAQAVAAFGGLYFLGGLSGVDFVFFELSTPVITNIFAFLIFIWFMNLYNFLDGINGYAGGEALFLALCGFALFGGGHFLVLAAAVLGFLCWNWGDAKIFMGDVGSVLLGYNVAVFTIYYTNEQSSNFWVWVILFGLFWVDATITLIRRKLNGEKLSQAHKKHAYQRLTQSGWSHSKVATSAMILNIVVFLVLYSMQNVAISFFVSLAIFLYAYIYVEKIKPFS